MQQGSQFQNNKTSRQQKVSDSKGSPQNTQSRLTKPEQGPTPYSTKDCRSKTPYHPAPEPPSAQAQGLAAPPQGPWAVRADTFTVRGLVARGSQKASIWQPFGTPPPSGSPVVSFAHGAPGGGPTLFPSTYGPLLSALASWGYVVVAPDSCVPVDA